MGTVASGSPGGPADAGRIRPIFDFDHEDASVMIERQRIELVAEPLRVAHPTLALPESIARRRHPRPLLLEDLPALSGEADDGLGIDCHEISIPTVSEELGWSAPSNLYRSGTFSIAAQTNSMTRPYDSTSCSHGCGFSHAALNREQSSCPLHAPSG